MADFFVSYTQVDQAPATWIAETLEEAGYTVIIEAWDFLPGSNFVVGMHKAVSEADRTIAVLSPDYLKSLYCRSEWTAAFVKDPTGEAGVLVPVLVREVDLDGLLASVVHIDLVGVEEPAAKEKLLAGLDRKRRKPISMLALPLNEVPAPGPLPPGSRMPFAVNPLFVGRQEEIRDLARQLEAGRTTAVGQIEIAAASGLGGIGKTQLACEFVHRYGYCFAGGVFWLNFADAAGVPAEVAASGKGLGLHPRFDGLPLDRQTFLVEEAWTWPIPRLLVFDNCEEEMLLDRWRPRFGGTRVLVTSRRPLWDQAFGIRSVPLGTLPRAASVELLRRFRPEVAADDSILETIAEELGDLPLALHLAGSFLQRYAHSLSGQPMAYLAALRRRGLLDHPSLAGKDSPISPTGHEGHVARTFALSFERLKPNDETDALALALLARAAYFASGEPIPRNLLLRTVDTGPADPDDTRAEDALIRLTALGLLESTDRGALVAHRLVASFARKTERGAKAQLAVERALREEANLLNMAGVPGPLLLWQAHLRAVTDAALEREDISAVGLANTLGHHLRLVGDFAEALPYLERALEVCEKVLGPEHPDTATCLNNLGFLFRAQGVLLGARPYYERALAIREKVLGLEHADTARSLNNLGFLLQAEGDLGRARTYYEQALVIWEKVLGPEHPDTARSLNNLGFLLQAQGDFSGALSYLRQALAIREKVLGPEHPDTAQSLNNLGSLFESQGDFAAALPYYERALKIFEDCLGPNHPDSRTVRNNLQGLTFALGEESPVES